jgi:hypothetical protein
MKTQNQQHPTAEAAPRHTQQTQQGETRVSHLPSRGPTPGEYLRTGASLRDAPPQVLRELAAQVGNSALGALLANQAGPLRAAAPRFFGGGLPVNPVTAQPPLLAQPPTFEPGVLQTAPAHTHIRSVGLV